VKEWLFAPNVLESLFMSLAGKIEAIIYAAEQPVTLDQLASLLRRDVLADLDAQGAGESSASGDAGTDDNSGGDGAPTEAPTETATASEEPSEARHHPERAPDFDEPLSAPESIGSVATGTSTAVAPKRKKAPADPELAQVKAYLRGVIETVMASYTTDERGVEIRQIAGGYRMATKPEHHDLVRAYAKSLKPPIRLSLQALETLAIIAYKQPVTQPEIAEIRGVDSGGVLGTLLDRKLITTAGRKQVIGRPMQYKTTKEFLMRFGLNDLNELPSMEEFEKLAQEQTDMFSGDVPVETGPSPTETSGEQEFVEREGDYSSGADTSESVVRAQVYGDEAYSGASASSDRDGASDSQPQRPPDEPKEPADAGDRSDGADTSETIVREQMEDEEKRS
jgi:segregation and condensation protein B